MLVPTTPKTTNRRQAAAAITARQQAAERRRKLIVLVVAILVVVGVIVLIASQASKKHTTGPAAGSTSQVLPSTPGGGATTKQPKPAVVPNTTGVPGVVAYDTKGYPAPGSADAGTLGHDHVNGTIVYAVTPPVGGPHNPIWMNAGVYTQPVPTEHAVHDLEHGAIWITYRPSLPAAQVKHLADFVGKQSLIDESSGSRIAGQQSRFIVMSPWTSDSLPAPIVFSSWGYQLKVDSPTDPRLQKFVDTFRDNQTYSPEFGSPVDGIPVLTGGRPAEYGATQPNPSGSVPGS